MTQPKWSYEDLLDAVMASEAGRAFVHTLIEQSLMLNVPASTDPNATLFNAGRRSVGAELWQALVNHCPTQLTLCLTEHFAEASRVRRSIDRTRDDGPADYHG